MHCDVCGGRGRKIKHVCTACKGHRIVEVTSELILHIDRGLPEGAEVLFEGEADESPELPAGDVIVRVRSRRKQGGFVRKEANLYWKETLSVAEVSRACSAAPFADPALTSAPSSSSQALLGFKRTVTGLDGHEIVLSRSGVTQPGARASLPPLSPSPLADLHLPLRPGFVQTVKGEGLPIYHESGHGDLFVEYSIVLPTTISDKARTTLEGVFDYHPTETQGKHVEL